MKHVVRHGPVSRTVSYLSGRGFTAFDALMIPFHVLFASIMLVTPEPAIDASPVYGRLVEVAPIWAWASLLIVFALSISSGIIWSRWQVARVGYVLVAAWWFSIGGLVYLASTTLLSPSVYILIGVACLYRQAEIYVEMKYGDE